MRTRTGPALAGIALLLALLVAASSCGGGSTTVAPPPAGPVDPCAPVSTAGIVLTATPSANQWGVLPSATDLCITTNPDSHMVYRAPSVAPVGRLFVFLPGTGAIAQNYRLIVWQAALNGYHAVGLTYPNDQAVGGLCAATGGSCYADTRLEILTGQPASSVVTVTRANSIENRLVKLLRAMRTADPAGSWGQFLVGDSAVTWHTVSVAGHSQGGGHALFISQRYAVWRATAHASGGDFLANGTTPAPWVGQPFATPASNRYGFVHTADELVNPTAVVAAWTSIGMGAFGATTSVDGASPPFGGSHILTTSAAPANPSIGIGPNHNVPAVDVNTPKAPVTNLPTFAPVWRYLSFP